MKNQSFQVSCSVAYNPKILKLKRMTGSTGCWSLVCLWAYTAAHKPDGILLDMTASEIEQVAGWHGKKGKFYNALVACGLLDIDDGFPKVHEWELHNPWQTTAKQRTEKAKRAALSRWHSNLDHSPPQPQPTTPKRNARSNARSNATSINYPPTIDNFTAKSKKPSNNGHSSMLGALLEHDQLQYSSHALGDLQSISSSSPEHLQSISSSSVEQIEVTDPVELETLSNSSPFDPKPALNGHSSMPQALLDSCSSNATSNPQSIAQASKSGDAYIRVGYSEQSDPPEPPPTPPASGGGQGEGKQYFVITEPPENPEMPSGKALQPVYPPNGSDSGMPQSPVESRLQPVSPVANGGSEMPQTLTETAFQMVSPTANQDNGITGVLGKPDWDGDTGFAEWLSKLWNFPIASVYQYLRKAKRDSTTAFDAENFYRDYQREQSKPQPETRIDWLSHPNREAYNARCVSDCYQFLLEFPSGSPERSLRASFVQWFLSQQKSPLTPSQIPQEERLIPSLVPVDDYDF